MLGASLKNTVRHPNGRLQLCWNCFQLGLLIYPLSPLIGIIGLLLSVLGTWILEYRQIIHRPQNLGFAVVGILLILTTIFAEDKAVAFLGLFNLVPYFIVFAGFSRLIETGAQLRHISWILTITSVAVVALGFGQLFLGWALTQQWAEAFGCSLSPGGNPPGRMASVFMYANIFAGYLVIVFILSLGLWLESYQKFRTKNFHPGRFIFLTLAVIANLAGLILTDSRNGWVIIFIACLAYAFYQGWRLLVAFVCGVAASVLLAAFAPAGVAQLFRKVVPAFFWARFNDQLYPDRPIALLRKTQWEFAWSLTVQRPWTGWGLRNFTPLYLSKMHIWLGHPHDLFLMLSAEIGLPITILFCALIAWILIDGIQLLQNPHHLEKEDRLIFFSYLIVFGSLVLFNTVDVSLFDLRLNSLSWLLLAAISGVAYQQGRGAKYLTLK